MVHSVGVLALQGCIEPHLKHLKSIGVDCLLVKDATALEKVDRLILPGGESTTMLDLLERTNLFSPLIEFSKTRPVWGICAGAILLAKEVQNPRQKSLGIIEVRALRNYYGSQLQSFKSKVDIPVLNKTLEVDFIRAPLLEPMGQNVVVLAKHKDQAVLLQEGKILLSSFHTELGLDSALHEYFIKL